MLQYIFVLGDIRARHALHDPAAALLSMGFTPNAMHHVATALAIWGETELLEHIPQQMQGPKLVIALLLCRWFCFRHVRPLDVSHIDRLV